jgi:hypothetical protein
VSRLGGLSCGRALPLRSFALLMDGVTPPGSDPGIGEDFSLCLRTNLDACRTALAASNACRCWF